MNVKSVVIRTVYTQKIVPIQKAYLSATNQKGTNTWGHLGRGHHKKDEILNCFLLISNTSFIYFLLKAQLSSRSLSSIFEFSGVSRIICTNIQEVNIRSLFSYPDQFV